MLAYPLSARLKNANNYLYRGEIRAFADDPRCTYTFADLTPAYTSAKAERVQRAFSWLKPSTFVICDWVKSTKPEFATRWLLHSANKPSIDGTEKVVTGKADAGMLESTDSHAATMVRGKSKLVLRTLLPETPHRDANSFRALLQRLTFGPGRVILPALAAAIVLAGVVQSKQPFLSPRPLPTRFRHETSGFLAPPCIPPQFSG